MKNQTQTQSRPLKHCSLILSRFFLQPKSNCTGRTDLTSLFGALIHMKTLISPSVVPPVMLWAGMCQGQPSTSSMGGLTEVHVGFDPNKQNPQPGSCESQATAAFPQRFGAAGVRDGQHKCRAVPRQGCPWHLTVMQVDRRNQSQFQVVVLLQDFSCASVLPILNQYLSPQVNLQQHLLPFRARHPSAP